MSRAAAGAALGVLAAALALTGHLAGGGGSAIVVSAILVAASALIFAAAAELRAPTWALVSLGALAQLGGHLLLAPLEGQTHVGGQAHGMPLVDGGAVMAGMHALSFAAFVIVVAVAAPLAGILLRLVTVLAPSESLAPRRVPVAARERLAARASTLRHVVVRRGPPAFV
jgi:hypothetical protein